MVETSPGHFTCPTCGKQHQWKSQLAGCKVKCPCGARLRLPEQTSGEIHVLTPPPASEPDSYALAQTDDTPTTDTPAPAQPGNLQPADPDGELNPYEIDLPENDDASPDPATPAVADAPATDQPRCPQCNSPMKSHAIICIHCGYHRRQGRGLRTQVVGESPEPIGKASAQNQRSLIEQQNDPEQPAYVNATVAAARREDARKAAQDRETAAHYRRLNLTYPILLMASGPIVIILGGILLQRSVTTGIFAAGLIAALEILVMTPLLLLSVIVGASLLKLEFGTIGQVFFKCMAISVGPGALADIIALAILGLMGFVGMLLAPFLLYLAFIGLPLSKLFDLDFNETTIMAVIAVIVRLSVFLLVFTEIYHFLV